MILYINLIIELLGLLSYVTGIERNLLMSEKLRVVIISIAESSVRR